MIAWKRVYIEQDNMYTNGATITANAAAGATNLTVDSTADFSVGDSVVVFWKDGSFNTTISNKTDAPVVHIFLGGGGAGAAAEASLHGGQVTSVFVTAAGSNYTHTPVVQIVGGTGAGATANAVLPPTSVSAIPLISGGSGYTNAPTVIIAPPPLPVAAGGVQATATAVVAGGQVIDVVITNPGAGYLLPSPLGHPAAPLVDFSGGGGSNANASVTLAPRGLHSIRVTNGGAGYLSRVTISPALTNAVPRFAGIRPAVEPTTYEVDRRYLPNAFGRLPDGSDGGAFIEFLDAPTGNGNVPKYKSFPDYIHWYRFANYWFDNSTHRANNVLNLLAANRTCANVTGWGYSVIEPDVGSLTVAFVGILPSAISRDEVVAHEIGHRLDVTLSTFAYVDQKTSMRNHADTDFCIMNYSNNWHNGISEFSLDAIRHTRELDDK